MILGRWLRCEFCALVSRFRTPGMCQHIVLRQHWHCKFMIVDTVMAMAISYNWLFLWAYTFYKWGFLSTYNWYNSGLNCDCWYQMSSPTWHSFHPHGKGSVAKDWDQQKGIRSVCNPLDPCMLYMVTFTIHIPQMLAYIPYMDPIGNYMRFVW